MFREADVGERELLDEMTLAGLRHWGHHEQHPEIYAGFAQMLAAEPGPSEHPVVVLEENERIVGFYELRDRGEDIELLRMFLRDDLIGRGYGRQLWDEAVRSASLTHQRMTIMSDPGSIGFYQAMGAVLEGHQEVAPGFILGAFVFDLTTASDSSPDVGQ